MILKFDFLVDFVVVKAGLDFAVVRLRLGKEGDELRWWLDLSVRKKIKC
jgi:hypothetical protein